MYPITRESLDKFWADATAMNIDVGLCTLFLGLAGTCIVAWLVGLPEDRTRADTIIIGALVFSCFSVIFAVRSVRAFMNARVAKERLLSR